MTNFIDFTGRKFGRLTVIKRTVKPGRRDIWLCRCECGKEKVVCGHNLKRGDTISCGCYARERLAKANFKHGQAATSEYRTWAVAKDRCFNPKNRRYQDYGGRGITMCAEWRDSFEAFFAYVGPRPAGMSIDRKDNDGNYEPGNMRWATPKEQINNRRVTKHKVFEEKQGGKENYGG